MKPPKHGRCPATLPARRCCHFSIWLAALALLDLHILACGMDDAGASTSSSSTSIDKKPSCSDPAEEFPTPDEACTPIAELIPVNESDHVYLDQDQSRNWWITNTVTLEKYALDNNSHWSMTCNPETGRGIVWSSDESGTILEMSPVDSLLKKELFTRSDTGEILIVDDHMSLQVPLEQINTRFREGVLEVKVGATAGTLKLTSYVFEKPRSTGTRFFVDLRSMFNALQLSQYRGIPSKWVYASKERWQRLCGPLGTSALVMGQDCADKLDFQLKCLPFPSSSLPMTVYLTLVWSTAPKNLGGFETPNRRAAANELFIAFCNASLEHLEPRSNVVDFDLADVWASMWPRPQPPGNLLSVQLDSRGIHVQSFEPSSADPDWPLFKLWNQCQLSQLLTSDGQNFVPVHVFAQKLMTKCLPHAKSIIFQLVWHLSGALERKSLLQATGKFTGDRTSSTLQLTAAADSFANKYKVAKIVNSYVGSTRSCRMHWQHLFMSTDKGDGGNLPLQQTAISAPDNLCIIALPQAA